MGSGRAHASASGRLSKQWAVQQLMSMYKQLKVRPELQGCRGTVSGPLAGEGSITSLHAQAANVDLPWGLQEASACTRFSMAPKVLRLKEHYLKAFHCGRACIEGALRGEAN